MLTWCSEPLTGARSLVHKFDTSSESAKVVASADGAWAKINLWLSIVLSHKGLMVTVWDRTRGFCAMLRILSPESRAVPATLTVLFESQGTLAGLLGASPGASTAVQAVAVGLHSQVESSKSWAPMCRCRWMSQPQASCECSVCDCLKFFSWTICAYWQCCESGLHNFDIWYRWH